VDFPGILLDVDLELDIQHSYTGDLEVRLSIVDGPGITILDRPGPPPLYCDQDNIQAIFDDEASASASQVCNPSPALSGPLRPEQPLSTFDNLPATSRWQLVVTDRSSPDSGFLNGWCILATIR
jgi:extracellular elastinolytic metalloproteinase